MTLLNIFFCFICSIGLTIGQLLMKKASMEWNQSGVLLNTTVISWIGSAFLIYVIASMGWLYTLKGVSLSKAYPFLAITYLIIPIADYLFFNQKVVWQDVVAMLLIILGIFMISSTPKS